MVERGILLEKQISGWQCSYGEELFPSEDTDQTVVFKSFYEKGFALLLSVETHRRAATGNTKSREVAGALAGTAPSSTARNSVTRPEIP